MIKNSLGSKYNHFVNDIIRVIIFDSLIGNGDRHQENWAIISEQHLIFDLIEKLEKEENFNKLPTVLKWIIRGNKKLYKSAYNSLEESKQPIPKSHYESQYRFAPIYDSGSSLGRELTEEKILQLLGSEVALNHYIERGFSEIHWNNTKLSHFELIRKIRETAHVQNVESIITQIVSLFDSEKLMGIINLVDEKVPVSYSHYKIPQKRKELIFKIITLRFEKLKLLANERI